MKPFAEATAVTEIEADRYSGRVAEGWDIVGNANGGYLLAIAARALVAATGRPDPVSITGHYLSPGKVGPLDISTAVVKAGKRFSTARAEVATSAGTPVLAVLGTFGDLSLTDGPELVHGEPPVLPDPDDCTPVMQGDPLPPAFMGRVELRLLPEDARFLDGAPSGYPLIRGWFRLREDEPVDTTALLCVVDSFPPTIFNARLPVAWTPTVELTTHIRSTPAPGWLACSFRTRFVSRGFLEVDTEVWDTGGTLVAQARQLALVPRPPVEA